MNRTASRRPSEDEWSSDYHGQLIAATSGDDALRVLEDQLFWMCELASHLSTETVDKIHPPHSWTIRQVFEHGVDCERLFGSRMLRIAAGDPTPLDPFDENAYADARFGLGNFCHLVTEWGYLRQSNLLLLRRVSPRCWNNRGNLDGQFMTLRSLAWITAGHLRHHFEIVEKRSGQNVQRTPLMK